MDNYESKNIKFNPGNEKDKDILDYFIKHKDIKFATLVKKLLLQHINNEKENIDEGSLTKDQIYEMIREVFDERNIDAGTKITKEKIYDMINEVLNERNKIECNDTHQEEAIDSITDKNDATITDNTSDRRNLLRQLRNNKK